MNSARILICYFQIGRYLRHNPKNSNQIHSQLYILVEKIYYVHRLAWPDEVNTVAG